MEFPKAPGPLSGLEALSQEKCSWETERIGNPIIANTHQHERLRQAVPINTALQFS